MNKSIIDKIIKFRNERNGVLTRVFAYINPLTKTIFIPFDLIIKETSRCTNPNVKSIKNIATKLRISKINPMIEMNQLNYPNSSFFNIR